MYSLYLRTVLLCFPEVLCLRWCHSLGKLHSLTLLTNFWQYKDASIHSDKSKRYEITMTQNILMLGLCSFWPKHYKDLTKTNFQQSSSGKLFAGLCVKVQLWLCGLVCVTRCAPPAVENFGNAYLQWSLWICSGWSLSLTANCQQTAWDLILYVFFSVFSFLSCTCYFARY